MQAEAIDLRIRGTNTITLPKAALPFVAVGWAIILTPISSKWMPALFARGVSKTPPV